MDWIRAATRVKIELHVRKQRALVLKHESVPSEMRQQCFTESDSQHVCNTDNSADSPSVHESSTQPAIFSQDLLMSRVLPLLLHCMPDKCVCKLAKEQV